MRSVLFGSALVALVLFATPAAACEECAVYFDYQVNDWCEYCATAKCGYFNCTIVQYDGFDICGGDDAGCFEYGGHCEEEPQPLAWEGGDTRLRDKWRLVRVHAPDPPTPQRIRR